MTTFIQTLLRFLFLSIITGSLLGCNKNCETSATCKDTAPTNELCAAYFSRWFYDDASNNCELKNYSGCSSKGFETKAECESCKCN